LGLERRPSRDARGEGGDKRDSVIAMKNGKGAGKKNESQR